MASILKSHFFRFLLNLVVYCSTIVVPLSLMLTSPIIVIALWQISSFYDRSVESWVYNLPFSLIEDFPSLDIECASQFGAMVLIQFLLLILLPGDGHLSTITPMGNRPWYKLNGPSSYVITHAIFFALWYYDIYSLSWVFHHFGDWLLTSSALSFAWCIVLYFQGIYFPSSGDSGRTGSGAVWDFWWGTELHPTVFGYAVKQLINCRVGMTCLWQLLNWSGVVYQYEVYGSVSYGLLCCVSLQFVYLFKFFLWEDGYFASMDIQHDRFGYYICWGILNWVPGLYAHTAMDLARQRDAVSPLVAAAIFAVGVVAIYSNYAADVQRQLARRTNGKCLIWGKAPRVIRASYKTGDGKTHESLLLCSGFWGVARHFHYVAELASCVCWTLPAGFGHLSPWAYVIFLTILLTDRAYRDELRCQKK